MKKCIIIGGGLGGLSCGSILAKNGYDVTVLEQSAQTGGCLQCFRRDGTFFQTGMHYVGSADNGQILNTIFRYLEIYDNITFSRLDPNGYDVIQYLGNEYSIANGEERFIDTLASEFPKSRDDLKRYLDLVRQVATSSALHTLNNEKDSITSFQYQNVSINNAIESVVSDPVLQQVLVGAQLLYAGEADRTPFATHALVSDFYLPSAFRIVGGSRNVASALCATIKKYGGTVETRKKVEMIECDSTHATAVITEDGTRYPADIVISTIHPAHTVELVKGKLLRPVYRNRMKNAHNTVAAFQLYIKYKRNKVKYMNHNKYFCFGEKIWGAQEYTDETWPKYLLYMHSCQEKDPLYAEGGEVITYMNYDEVRKWVGTKCGQRGDDYETFKKMKAEKIIDTLNKYIPGIRDTIESYYVSTPLTYSDYTGTPEGCMYGIAHDVNDLGTLSIPVKTHIPNLLLAGQSVTSHGMLGVLAGSILTCTELIELEELFRKIREMKVEA